MKRTTSKHAAVLAAALTLLAAASLRAEPLYPEVANTSHATPEVAAFFKSYFTAKSEHKPVPTTDHFSEAHRDTHSALVAFTDTPELFGAEIRILAAIDFKDGKVVRWIDYWDGRSF